MPSAPEVDRLYEALLGRLNLPDAALAPMRKKSTADKWTFVNMAVGAEASASASLGASDREAVDAIRDACDRPSLDALRSLRTCLRTSRRRWLEEFYAYGGHGVLAGVLWVKADAMREGPTELDVAVVLEVAGCVKALVNHASGLDRLVAEGGDLLRSIAAAALARPSHVIGAHAAPPLLELLTVVARFSPERGRSVVAAAVRSERGRGGGDAGALADAAAGVDAGPLAGFPTRLAVRAAALSLANELVCGEADEGARAALRAALARGVAAALTPSPSREAAADAAASLGEAAGVLVAAPPRDGDGARPAGPPPGSAAYAARGGALAWDAAGASPAARGRRMPLFGRRGGGAPASARGGTLALADVVDVAPASAPRAESHRWLWGPRRILQSSLPPSNRTRFSRFLDRPSSLPEISRTGEKSPKKIVPEHPR